MFLLSYDQYIPVIKVSQGREGDNEKYYKFFCTILRIRDFFEIHPKQAVVKKRAAGARLPSLAV
jgi:hypothetical protein